MSHESEDALRQIREKADEAAKLEKVYERLHERAKESKAAWEVAEDELRELCRSWETSEEVASRPLVKQSEQAQEVFVALVSVGHTEAQARAAIEATTDKGPFASVNDWIEAIYSVPGIAEAANAATANGEPVEAEAEPEKPTRRRKAKAAASEEVPGG